jgi:uncharacterized radical SAM superfamily Fe-S cluster-containing enzyme
MKLAIKNELLKRTQSRCPVCHVLCPAEVWRTGGLQSKVFLRRTCPDHGEASVCIASDARFYWLAKGKTENGCCSNLSTLNAELSTDSCCSADGSNAGTLGRNANPGDALGVMEKLSTCLALIEIVNACNLSCPTCYADSPLGAGQKVDAIPLAQLQSRIQGVIDRKGKIEILQLSGGEPTLHPQFFELLRWLHANPGIDYVLLNTNGVLIAHDEEFAAELAQTFRYGKFQLYLQFDGPQAAGQKSLRGADLRVTRERCLARCEAMKLPVTLAMTVTPENISALWDAIEFGLKFPHVRGISFQPMFTSGRIPSPERAAVPPAGSRDFSAMQNIRESSGKMPEARLNTADIILAAVAQSAGKLRFDDFTPLPCGDPNCATIGYLLKVGGEIRSVSDFIDFKNVQGFLGNKVRYKLEDLMKCGCDSEPLGELLKQFELDASHTFRLFIKPFMDAATWDEDRIDRCCTHVIRPDGKLDSFCRYYSGFADCQVKRE